MFWKFPLQVQSYTSDTDAWYTTTFETKQDLQRYLDAQWKDEPQFYRLKNTKKWKETGLVYANSVTKPNFEGGRYHGFIKGSPKQKQWRDTEKDRILNGVIYDGVFVPGFYYWYLNFCPIYDDIQKKKRFADVWDGDLWYFQYCMRAILAGKHIGGVKGRQKGYSYKHMAILYWSYCWSESSVNTVGAFDEKLVKKSWRFLEGYRNHINRYTTWFRGPTLPKSLEWHEVQMDDNNHPVGYHSVLRGVTFKQKADNDVGGAQTFFNYEEPGVSPTLLETLEFMKPALVKGSVTTGIFIACGSVGQLDDAEGLKTLFYEPESFGFLAVKNVWDKKTVKDTCCIFISEAYNMLGEDDVTGKPFMDEDGNSDVELALNWIHRQKEMQKSSKKSNQLKQLALSQKCISPEEAFAQRTTSEFPVEQLKLQQQRILHKEANNLWAYKPQKGLFQEDNGHIILNTKNPPPEHQYPINPEWEDKRGVWTIYEPVDPNPENYLYYACVDAVEVDVTETSASVASVDIFKAPIWVEYETADGKRETRIEGDKLVANYRGRFNTARQTNEQMWLGIKLYNAWVYPERNKPNFINYMREMGRAEKYLAKESDVPLFKDLNIKTGNVANNSKFGFHKGDNTEIWKHLKATAKEYLATEYGRETFINDVGDEEVRKIYTGIDRIDDYWLLEEMIRFQEGKGNYDRLISFFGALFICKVYQQNQFRKTRSEVKKEEKKPVPKKPKSMLGNISYNRSMLGNSKGRRSMI